MTAAVYHGHQIEGKNDKALWLPCNQRSCTIGRSLITDPVTSNCKESVVYGVFNLW